MAKKLLLSSLLIIVFFIIGFFSHLLLLQWQGRTYEAGINNGYKNGWDKARDRLYESKMVSMIDKDNPVKSVTGTVIATANNSFDMKIVLFDPISDPILDIRKVLIGNNTKIVKMVSKDDETYKKELDIFLTNDGYNKVNGGGGTPPSPTIEQELTMGEIKSGTNLTIEANIDIRNQAAINADRIVVQ